MAAHEDLTIAQKFEEFKSYKTYKGNKRKQPILNTV